MTSPEIHPVAGQVTAIAAGLFQPLRCLQGLLELCVQGVLRLRTSLAQRAVALGELRRFLLENDEKCVWLDHWVNNWDNLMIPQLTCLQCTVLRIAFFFANLKW